MSPDSAPAEVTLDAKRLLVKTVVGICGLVLGVGVLALLFKDPLIDASGRFVETFGLVGLFFGFLLPDAFPLPLPHEAFSTFSLIGGVPFWTIVVVASSGSLIGGVIGFFIGRKLGHTGWFQRIMAGHGAEAHALVERYGGVALAIGALTPLPFFITCWAAGALDMTFQRYFRWSLLRIPRVIFYTWLIQIGSLSLLV